jgi:hypothetical protein
MGYSRDLAERSLAHTIKDKVEAAYHRTDLLEQRREVMNAWAAFVSSKLSLDSCIREPDLIPTSREISST